MGNDALEMAEVLLIKAREDLEIIREIVDNLNISVTGVGFHAQQAVEKALKSVLVIRC